MAYRYATALHRTRSRGGDNKRGTYRPAGRAGVGLGGGAAKIDHPVEAFVQKKLAEDFTETGTATAARRGHGGGCGGVGRRKGSEDAWRAGHENDLLEVGGFLERGWGGGVDGSTGDRYTRLLIPGTVYHMRKLGAESVAARAAGARTDSQLYWMERERPEEVGGCFPDTCIGVQRLLAFRARHRRHAVRLFLSSPARDKHTFLNAQPPGGNLTDPGGGRAKKCDRPGGK